MSFEMIENYAWVDECLRQMYYGYALTVENYDEFEDAGLLTEDGPLLTENWAWVDDNLEEMCMPMERMPILAPDEWADCSFNDLVCIEGFKDEFMSKKRSRSERDISDFEECIDNVIKRINCFTIIEEREEQEESEEAVESVEANCFTIIEEEEEEEEEQEEQEE